MCPNAVSIIFVFCALIKYYILKNSASMSCDEICSGPLYWRCTERYQHKAKMIDRLWEQWKNGKMFRSKEELPYHLCVIAVCHVRVWRNDATWVWDKVKSCKKVVKIQLHHVSNIILWVSSSLNKTMCESKFPLVTAGRQLQRANVYSFTEPWQTESYTHSSI